MSSICGFWYRRSKILIPIYIILLLDTIFLWVLRWYVWILLTLRYFIFIFQFSVYISCNRYPLTSSVLFFIFNICGCLIFISLVYCLCQRSREILWLGVAFLTFWWTQTFNLFKSDRYIFVRPLVTFIHTICVLGCYRYLLNNIQ